MVNKNFELQQKTTDLSTEDRYNVTGITFHDNISFKKSFAPPPTSPPSFSSSFGCPEKNIFCFVLSYKYSVVRH